MNAKLGVRVNKHADGVWIFACGLVHADSETYVYINVFKWHLSFGKMYK